MKMHFDYNFTSVSESQSVSSSSKANAARQIFTLLEVTLPHDPVCLLDCLS